MKEGRDDSWISPNYSSKGDAFGVAKAIPRAFLAYYSG